jgi:hypothetical protein
VNSFNSLNIDEFTTDFYHRIDLRGYVLFVDNGKQVELVNYIITNYSIIQQAFKLEGKRFLLLSEIDNTSTILKPLRYHYPRLTRDDVWGDLNFETLKSYIGYEGTITTGLLAIDTVFKSQFIEFESTSITSFKKLTDGYLNDYKQKILDIVFDCDDMISYGDYNSDDNIKLDDETKRRVDIILEEFETLKDKGNLLQIIPIVEGYLKTQHTEHLGELSSLKIDENFTIFLRDYNLEIKLSHFTKSIYLLFLNHPEGILLTDLHSYKKELLEYYKSISNRDDLDKILITVEDLLQASSNAIYVHLSRIKSAFTKALHIGIAKHYFIDGGKNKPKKIQLNSSLIIWHNTLQIPTKKNASLDFLFDKDE